MMQQVLENCETLLLLSSLLLFQVTLLQGGLLAAYITFSEMSVIMNPRINSQQGKADFFVLLLFGFVITKYGGGRKSFAR